MRVLLYIFIILPAACFGQIFGAIGYNSVPAAGGGGGFTTEWNVEIDHTKCGTANTDTATILVKLQSDTLKHTSRGGYVKSMQGNDIRFYETDTNTLMKWDKERYDPDSGIVIMWVKKNQVTYATNGTFKMDCGRTYDTSTFHGGAAGSAWKSTVVAVYYMNDATGTNLTDASGKGNTGTRTNSPTRIGGKVGHAINMSSGSNQYYTTALTAIDGVSAVSFLFWGYRTSSSSNVLVSKHIAAQAISCYVYSDNFIYGQFGSAYGYFYNPVSTTWQHWGFVFDGTQSGNSNRCKIYMDGAAQSLSFSGTIGSTTSSTAGDMKYGKDGGLADLQNGNTDMLVIYKEAVSSSLVTMAYNNQNSPGNLGSAGFLRFYH